MEGHIYEKGVFVGDSVLVGIGYRYQPQTQRDTRGGPRGNAGWEKGDREPGAFHFVFR